MQANRREQVKTLLEAADALDSGTAPSLIRRIVSGIGNAAVNAGINEAFQRLIAAFPMRV